VIDFSVYETQKLEIFAYKCPECHAAYYPAPMLCAQCNCRRDPSGIVHKNWDPFPLEGPCTLLTWTRVWALPEGYDRPFQMFAIVEFPNGLKASGRLEAENPALGMRLSARVEESGERAGPPVRVFVFSES
jgi:uncharacterized protein